LLCCNSCDKVAVTSLLFKFVGGVTSDPALMCLQSKEVKFSNNLTCRTEKVNWLFQIQVQIILLYCVTLYYIYIYIYILYCVILYCYIVSGPNLEPMTRFLLLSDIYSCYGAPSLMRAWVCNLLI
jgi:hypothetical protein